MAVATGETIARFLGPQNLRARTQEQLAQYNRPPAGPGGVYTPPPAAPPAAGPTSAPSTPPTYPSWQMPQSGGVGAYGGNSSGMGMQGGTWTPMSGDTSVDPNLLATLRGRAEGGGMVPWDRVYNDTFLPQAGLIDLQFQRSMDAGLENLIGRGVLQSGETQNFTEDLVARTGMEKGALLGDLAFRYEGMKQENINAALNQLGILEGNMLSARTSITTANIGAAAQVQSAALSAGATVQAAQISASARLTEAGMNYELALRGMDQEWAMEGWDPVRMQNDPEYRGYVLDYIRNREEERDALITGALAGQLGQYATSAGNPLQ